MIMKRWKYALHMTSVNTALLVPYTFTVSFIVVCPEWDETDHWLLVFYCPLVVKVCQPQNLMKTTYPACKTAIHHSHTQFFGCKAVTSNASCTSYTWSAAVQTAGGAFANVLLSFKGNLKQKIKIKNYVAQHLTVVNTTLSLICLN